MLLRSAMREPLPLFAPATVMKSAPSIDGGRWMERTSKADVRGQVCGDARRSSAGPLRDWNILRGGQPYHRIIAYPSMPLLSRFLLLRCRRCPRLIERETDRHELQL